MEPNLLISLSGIFLFGVLMFFAFKYANGKWNVSESKRPDYNIWTKKHGGKLKKALIIVSIIYGVFMLIQILSIR